MRRSHSLTKPRAINRSERPRSGLPTAARWLTSASHRAQIDRKCRGRCLSGIRAPTHNDSVTLDDALLLLLCSHVPTRA